MIETRSASRCRLMVFAAGIGLLALVTVGLAQQPDKGKGADDKPPPMSYTVTKLKAGILKLVLNHSPLGPQYDMEIDTTPKNTTPGIRNEVPVRVEYSVEDHTIAVDMLPGAKGVRTVSFDGKKIPLAKADAPAAKAKKDKGDKNDKPATPEEKADKLLAGGEPTLADFSGTWRSSVPKKAEKKRSDHIKFDAKGKGYGGFLFDDGAGNFNIVATKVDLVIKDNAVYSSFGVGGRNTNWKLTLAENKKSFEMECLEGNIKGLKLSFTKAAK